MDRYQTYVTNQQVLPAELNGIQDNAFGLAQAEYLMLGAAFISSNNNNDVVVSALKMLILGGKKFSVASATTISPSLASTGWRYLYWYDNAGTITLEASSTAPTADLLSKGGDATRRYVGCFYIWDDSGTKKIKPFSAARGTYVWRTSLAASAAFTWGAVTSTTFVDVDLSTKVPPHALLADIFAELSGTGQSGNYSASIVTKPDTTSPLVFQATANNFASLTFPLELNTSQVFQAKVTTGSGSPSLSGRVMGFTEGYV